MTEIKAKRVDIRKLILDVENPRLPDEYRNSSQSSVLRYLYENDVLEELAESMLENGYFEHEPLLITKKGDKWVVLEGNRRFATLIILHQLPLAKKSEIVFDLENVVDQEKLTQLNEIPSFEVKTREDIGRYIGFRHIGGIKPWSSDAKARYLYLEVKKVAGEDFDNPIWEVAQRVGSSSQGVKNAYQAYALLLHARDELDLNTKYVLENRFGVWQRALNSGELKEFIGFDSARPFSELESALAEVNADHFGEVIDDLTPKENSTALLTDSRDITVYGQILTNEAAHRVLRKSNNLEVAKQMVEEAELPARIRHTADIVSAIMDRLATNESLNSELSELSNATEHLYETVRNLRGAVRERTGENENG